MNYFFVTIFTLLLQGFDNTESNLLIDRNAQEYDCIHPQPFQYIREYFMTFSGLCMFS